MLLSIDLVLSDLVPGSSFYSDLFALVSVLLFADAVIFHLPRF